MEPVLVFDMNETLLDMSALDPTFAGGPEPKYQAADLTMLAERVCADLT